MTALSPAHPSPASRAEPESLLAEVRRFDGTAPLAAAHTPPSSWYLDERFLELERRTVFRDNWLAVGRREQVREPGHYLAGSALAEPYLVIRGDDGVLRAFHNACRHHAAVVARGAGCVEALVCPYHGWTYGRDGALRSAPRLGAVREFKREDYGLRPLAVAEWGDWVFVCFGDAPRDLGADLRPLHAALAEGGGLGLRWVAQRSYDMECNWKVYVDNYLDGGYHIAHLHKGLDAQLEMADYRTELFERYSIQSCPASGGEAGERVGRGALYAWIHPNLMINRYGRALDTNVVLPLSQERTRVVFDFYFEDPDDAAVAESLAITERIQREDMEISKSVQEGLHSSSYDTGRYAPGVETGEFHFHRLLAGEYTAGLAG